ncbi:alpha/beta-hydrolase [Aspergillus ambiguus]|uniref:putative carboxylesterase n=1 Tax=Aspergillus ambiguus TaxID=176160 RepID=UPI003CCCCF16
MDTSRHPYRQSLGHRGHIEGVTVVDNASQRPLCHYFGGLRYGLPPSQRWRRAQKLPATYTYGTASQPGVCPGATKVCPQPRFLNLSFGDNWDEDCFQCNIWVPTGAPPPGGWPVLFFIHGGFLQFGSPNTFDASALLGDPAAAFNAIVVMPAYRVGIFGFLASSELSADAAAAGDPAAGNQGIWDQRLALEWTRDHIGLFGGDPRRITIAGYSAGAYSVFYQLAYDLRQPAATAIVSQACIFSNSPATQPRSAAQAQAQYNEVLSAVNLPLDGPGGGGTTLAALRALPASTLLDAAARVPTHQFRPWTDDDFVSAALFRSLDSGAFARRLAARRVRVLTGECRDERHLYATWFPPAANTADALRARLRADYHPPAAVDALMQLYYGPAGGETLPANCANWDVDAFGRVYADMQVHCMQRGLVDSLVRGGADHLLYRYRVEFRLRCADESIPPEWSVTHATDQYLWFWGNGSRLEAREKEVIHRAFIGPWTRFVHGEDDIGWGTRGHRQVRRLRPDGEVDIWEDELWEEAMRVWRGLRELDAAVAKL